LGINLGFFIIVESLGNRNFLNNFDKASSKLIDLYESASSAVLFLEALASGS